MALTTATTKQEIGIATSGVDAFSKRYSAGSEIVHSGIYKCTGCNKEITSNQGDKFPPQNHHQHGSNLSTIKWKIIVFTDTEGKY